MSASAFDSDHPDWKLLDHIAQQLYDICKMTETGVFSERAYDRILAVLQSVNPPYSTATLAQIAAAGDTDAILKAADRGMWVSQAERLSESGVRLAVVAVVARLRNHLDLNQPRYGDFPGYDYLGLMGYRLADLWGNPSTGAVIACFGPSDYLAAADSRSATGCYLAEAARRLALQAPLCPAV